MENEVGEDVTAGRRYFEVDVVAAGGLNVVGGEAGGVVGGLDPDGEVVTGAGLGEVVAEYQGTVVVQTKE